MEHYELEDLFGRRQRPVLKLQVTLIPGETPEHSEELAFSFLNTGLAVAKHAGFICTCEKGGFQGYAVDTSLMCQPRTQGDRPSLFMTQIPSFTPMACSV